MRSLRLAGLLLWLGLPVVTASAAGPRWITVDAGDGDRTNTLVSFPIEPATPGREWRLRAPDGSQRPLQIADGQAWFLETGLGRGTSRRYRLERRAPRPAPTALTALHLPGKAVVLGREGREVARLVAGPGEFPRQGIRPEFLRGGYLHPVRTPAGRVVTDDYPPNHIHHHGLWTAWTRTRFQGHAPDFWNMGDRKGRVDFTALDTTYAGPVLSGFQARLVQTDLISVPPTPALEETWKVRLLAGSPDQPWHLIDFESNQRCAGSLPLELPKYYYGGFGYRGPMAWNGPTAVRYLDSNGVTQRALANETRVRWYWLGGDVDGHLSGIALLGHPDNFRFPQPVRIHPTEPFSCWAPSQLGDWAIRPGETHRMRYRLMVLDGEPQPAVIDRLWEDFAHPPTVRTE